MPRHDGRAAADLRPISIQKGFLRNSHGSVLYRAGGTVLAISASITERVPPFLEGKGSGWLTAEYAMLPGSTPNRKPRGTDGRGTEIQRLIGRSLRAAFDLELLGPRTIYVDADVLEADGGTRTAAITGGFVAVVEALTARFGADLARRFTRDRVTAVSVGVVAGTPLLDLDYPEDSNAEVDLNVVRLGRDGFVEIQGTGEGGIFTRTQLDALLDLATIGLDRLADIQGNALARDRASM